MARPGCASLFQTTTRDGKRSSTYHAFLEPVLERENLTIITHALVEQVLLETDGGGLRATGVRYRDADGGTTTIHADREVVVSAGAIGSPQLLLLSGIGPTDELASVGVECVLDNPHVGKHLKDHLHVPLAFPAPGVGADHDRDRDLARPGRAARPGRSAARRSGRRRRPAAGARRRSRPRPSAG